MHKNSLVFLKFKNAPSDVNDKLAEEVHNARNKLVVNSEVEKNRKMEEARKAIENKEKEAKLRAIEEANKLRSISWETLRANPENLDQVMNITDVDETIYPHIESFVNLRSISFDDKFNSTINLSKLEKLESVTFGVYFNQSVNKTNFPVNLKKLVFGLNFIRKVENVPEFLEELVFDNRFNTTVNLPLHLKKVVFGDGFNQLIALPDSLQHLKFGYHFNKMINIPSNLVTLELGSKFNQEMVLNNKLEHLTLGNQFNKKLVLPNSVKVLNLRNKSSLANITLNKDVKVVA